MVGSAWRASATRIQQPLRGVLRPKPANQVHHILGREQYIRLGNVSALPISDFQLVEGDLTEREILAWEEEGEWGHILEVDLEYPPELHDKHNAYPLAPDKTSVPRAAASAPCWSTSGQDPQAALYVARQGEVRVTRAYSQALPYIGVEAQEGQPSVEVQTELLNEAEHRA